MGAKEVWFRVVSSTAAARSLLRTLAPVQRRDRTERIKSRYILNTLKLHILSIIMITNCFTKSFILNLGGNLLDCSCQMRLYPSSTALAQADINKTLLAILKRGWAARYSPALSSCSVENYVTTYCRIMLAVSKHFRGPLIKYFQNKHWSTVHTQTTLNLVNKAQMLK